MATPQAVRGYGYPAEEQFAQRVPQSAYNQARAREDDYNPIDVPPDQYGSQEAGYGHHHPTLTPNPLSEFLANFLGETVVLATGVGKSLYNNSSVIIIGASVAGVTHYFGSGVLDAAVNPGFEGAVAVAKYVGLAFLLKAALEPVHKAYTNHIHHKQINSVSQRKEWINNRVVSYLTPMALAWIVAYATGLPVKLLEASGYMVGTFVLLKILDKGVYNNALDWHQNRQIQGERK